jgi:hypothetical protein
MFELTNRLLRACVPKRLLALLGAALLSVGFAGCGGSGSKTSSTSSTTATSSQSESPTTTTSPTSTTSSGSGGASVRTGPVHGRLAGENHAPKVNQTWRYSVTVTDASGHPLAGTVDIEFTFGGQVVGHDTPPTHPVVDGRWHDSLKFPAQAVGEPLSVQAVVHTRLGSITLDWPIEVTQ